MPASSEKLVLKSQIVNGAIKRKDDGNLVMEDDPRQMKKLEVCHHPRREW